MAYPVTGTLPSNKRAPVIALVAPLVLLSALDDVDDPINDIALSGKEAGATVYAVTGGTLEAPTRIEVRIATGQKPEDPWVTSAVPNPEVTSDFISDSGATGRALIRSSTPGEAKAALTLVAADITNSGATGRAVLQAANPAAVQTLLSYLTASSTASATVKGPMLMTARQSGVTMNAIGDSPSTATDVATLLVDLNDLISKYNTLRNDVIAANSNLNAVIVATKASGQMVT